MASTFVLEETVNLTSPCGGFGARFVPNSRTGRIDWFRQDLNEGTEMLMMTVRHCEVVRQLCTLDDLGWA